MLDREFNDLVAARLNYCLELLSFKAVEYATEDRLHNFRTAASLQGVTMPQALAGMMAKHTISIFDMCWDEKVLPMHMWHEKITDHINYLLLLEAIVTEGDRKTDASEDYHMG